MVDEQAAKEQPLCHASGAAEFERRSVRLSMVYLSESTQRRRVESRTTGPAASRQECGDAIKNHP
jgi:hypothetical protein